jgi:hypothetical protein
VTSSGTLPVTISNPFISRLLGGDSKAFAAVDLCPKSLAAGKSCMITVVFVAGPTYSQQTAVLRVVDNALNSPQTVSLSAKVINPQAALSTKSLGFDRQKVYTSSAAKMITLHNFGATALTINRIAIVGANPLDFVQSSNCPASLDPNRGCAVNVVFKPKAKGLRSATMVIADNTRNSPHTVLLSGTGN